MFSTLRSCATPVLLIAILLLNWSEIHRISALEKGIGIEQAANAALSAGDKDRSPPEPSPGDTKRLMLMLTDVQQRLTAIQQQSDNDSNVAPRADGKADLPAPTPEQIEGANAAEGIVQAAARRRAWTEQDRQQLRERLAATSMPDKERIIHELGDALVRGEIVKTYPGPLQ
jgi:hypothetical protein